MAVLLEGCIDQKGVLADWLRAQPVPSPRRVWIGTDPDHTVRAVLLARLALERRKLWRDALRLTLWRATGSSGGWLVPEQVARKRAACGA